jgi:hypothetical protein
MQLTDLVPGSQVVIDDGFNHLSGAAVAKTSNSIITLFDGRKFNARNGRRWGDKSTWHPVCIAHSYKPDGGLMTWDEANEINRDKRAEKDRYNLAIKLRDLPWKSYSLETLKAAENALISAGALEAEKDVTHA